MNTIEGNKLIAEFMNKKLHDDWIQQDGKLPDGLQYHSSWDWLLPAWVKFKTKRVNIIYSELSHLNTKFLLGVSSGQILKSFEALVEGIEWYNSEQSVKESDTTKAT